MRIEKKSIISKIKINTPEKARMLSDYKREHVDLIINVFENKIAYLKFNDEDLNQALRIEWIRKLKSISDDDCLFDRPDEFYPFYVDANLAKIYKKDRHFVSSPYITYKPNDLYCCPGNCCSDDDGSCCGTNIYSSDNDTSCCGSNNSSSDNDSSCCSSISCSSDDDCSCCCSNDYSSGDDDNDYFGACVLLTAIAAITSSLMCFYRGYYFLSEQDEPGNHKIIKYFCAIFSVLGAFVSLGIVFGNKLGVSIADSISSEPSSRVYNEAKYISEFGILISCGFFTLGTILCLLGFVRCSIPNNFDEDVLDASSPLLESGALRNKRSKIRCYAEELYGDASKEVKCLVDVINSDKNFSALLPDFKFRVTIKRYLNSISNQSEEQSHFRLTDSPTFLVMSANDEKNTEAKSLNFG